VRSVGSFRRSASAVALTALSLSTDQQIPSPAKEIKPPAEEMRALADDLVASIKRHNPEIGTVLGLPDAEHGRVTDNSLDGRAQRRSEEDVFRARLSAIDQTALEGRPEWLIYGFVKEALESSFASRVCETELWSVDQMGGWQVNYGQLAQMQPIDTDSLRQQALARFRAVARFADREIANLREGLTKGYTAPRENVKHVITQMDALIADDSPYYSPAGRSSASDFGVTWRAMIRGELVPAFRKCQSFLRDEYLPRAREAVGVSALPNGAACYRAKLRETTSLDVSPEEIRTKGLEEIERLKTEERAIALRLFKTDDLNQTFGTLDRKENRWSNGADVITLARTAARRAESAMPKSFGRLPKTRLVVTAVPRAEEATAADRYQPGTIDGKRPGEYQINAGRWVGQRQGDLEAVVFHETIPGHHLQIAISLERPEAHLITKLVGTAAFSEGWGLYAERLADEMKLYTADIDRLGMLQSRMYRAARLVVDTGLHAFGWPRERAIAFMKSLHLASDEEIASEVDRYVIWPGQATAYMTGALEIERLRAETQSRLGSAFDLRRFHDAVLEDGSVPLPMLRAKLARLN
jgi:uncharacterized protein (DUF885 family)